MTKNKVLKEGVLFTVYLEKEHVLHIKRLAARMSVAEGRDISASESVRLALEEIYPYNKQTEMFPDLGKKKRLKKKASEHQLSLV